MRLAKKTELRNQQLQCRWMGPTGLLPCSALDHHKWDWKSPSCSSYLPVGCPFSLLSVHIVEALEREEKCLRVTAVTQHINADSTVT